MDPDQTMDNVQPSSPTPDTNAAVQTVSEMAENTEPMEGLQMEADHVSASLEHSKTTVDAFGSIGMVTSTDSTAVDLRSGSEGTVAGQASNTLGHLSDVALTRSTSPENDPVDSAYVASDGEDDEEAVDLEDLERAKAAAAPPDADKSASKQRKFNYRGEVIRAVRRNMPALRTQRKHLDAKGKPLSVAAVQRQMTKDVLSPYEKEEWRSKDFAEDERADFESVRMMFVHDAQAKEYWLADYARIARKDDVEDVERKRRKLARSADETEDSSYEGGDETIVPQDEDDTDVLDTESEYEYHEAIDEKNKRKYRMPKALYRPEEMKEGTKQAIKDAIRTPPRYLYRASSGFGQKCTNGYDSITLHCPAAHINEDESCHDSMYKIPNGLAEFSEMLGRRFLWHDRRKDEMLSWTSSLLFALVHATGRLAKGQEDIVIHVIDTTQVTTKDGKPVDFHFAPDLLRLLDIKGWYGWKPLERNNLTRPWYTHEWVTHNVVKSPRKHSWEADIKDLLDKGLYTLLPHLRTPDEDDMRSLYHRCGYARSKYHRKGEKPTPVTWDQFTLAKRLSRCFLPDDVREEDPYCIPPLNLVIDILGIEARPKRDEGFMKWIRSNYSQASLTHVAYHNSTRIANNLPEQAQALNLSRDAAFALGLPETPGTRVWMADENFDWYGRWLRDASREINIRQRGKGAGESSLFLKELRRGADVAEEKMRERGEEKKGKEDEASNKVAWESFGVKKGAEGAGGEGGAKRLHEGDEQHDLMRPTKLSRREAPQKDVATTEPNNIPADSTTAPQPAGEGTDTDGNEPETSAEGCDGRNVVESVSDWAMSAEEEQMQVQMALMVSLESGLP